MFQMSKKEPEDGFKVVAQNKKARRNYEITEVFEAGIVLTGGEIKSIRAGHVDFADSYVRETKGELFLVGCQISPYKFTRDTEQEPTRSRKILMHRREIDKIAEKIIRGGLTVVPLRMYLKKGRCKLEIGVGRGKKTHDKREDVKRRDADREMARAMSGRRK